MRWLPLLGLIACFPIFQDDSYTVDRVRVLGIRALPAEARPNTAVSYEALVAGPDGEVTEPVEWAWCITPRRAEERTGVTASCGAGEDRQPIGASTVLLADACSRFGPIPPPVQGNEAPRRPADPDPTGGYHLPVHARVDGVEAIGFHRIRCDLAGATRDVFEAYQEEYTDNEHPVLAGVDLPATVEVGESVTLSVRATPDSAESYVLYVPERSVLVDRTETLTAWWYVTDGTLSRSRRELDGHTASTTWTAPNRPGTVHGWVVLRDSRGGSTWSAFTTGVRTPDVTP
ncbi:MAG: hypothetical protein ACI8PZ_006072 [Myxococcota bacterium]|jgi:hypothetical protein